MHKFAFMPLVDIPLAGIVLATFILHFNKWSRRRNSDTTVDLASRLPKARVRVVVLLICALILCWGLDASFWSLCAMLLILGLALVGTLGGKIEGGAFGFFAVAYLIREWAFGFPQLILHPEQQASRSADEHNDLESLIGQSGSTISPLRPAGDAEIGGAKYSVVAYDGDMIDLGEKVIVRAYRNGSLFVVPAPKINAGDELAD